MSQLARDSRRALIATLSELDECDLGKLYHEAQAMVQTNRKLKRKEGLVSAKTAPMCGVPEDELLSSGLNEAGFQ